MLAARGRCACALAVATMAGACTAAPAAGPPEVVVAPVAPASGPSATDPHRARRGTLLGRWEGLGRQSNGPTWPMELSIASLEEGDCATVVYPSQDCAGSWECTEASDGRSMRAVEHITRGADKCIDGGTMTLELSDDGETVAWHWEDDSSEITAHAKLRRSKGKEGKAPGAAPQ